MLVSTSSIFAQSKFVIIPSGYFTYGNYSDKTKSNQFSLFLSTSSNSIDYFVLGYEDISLKNDLWNYSQKNYSAGIHYWFLDYKLKFKIDGVILDSDYKDNSLSIPDYLSGVLISPEIVKGIYPFYFGGGYAVFNQSKNQKFTSHQVYLRTDYYPHYKFLINTLASLNFSSDGNELVSLQTTLSYFYNYELTFSSSFMIGSRKYFYNPDLMVFFNQLETQTSNYTARVDYNFYKNFIMTFVYQHSTFLNYSINYFVFGIKTSINF